MKNKKNTSISLNLFFLSVVSGRDIAGALEHCEVRGGTQGLKQLDTLGTKNL